MAKYPKKPKAPKKTASNATKEAYLDRVKEHDKKCRAIDAEIAKAKTLDKRVDAAKKKR